MSIQTTGDVYARRLPPAIRGIQTRFVQAKALWELPLRSLRMVHIIISYTPLAPFNGTITFSRQKAADILGVSTRSVSRYLNDLVEAGLIERLPQYRKNGIWDCTTVRWTALALEKYFTEAFSDRKKDTERFAAEKILLESNISVNTSDNNHPGRETVLSHKTKTYKNKEENKTVHSSSQKIPSPSLHERHLKQQMPGTPLDLIQPALSLGLNRIHVATLMKNCKQTSQRLQDLFTLYLDKLLEKKIIGKAALAWLLAVIRRGQDAGWLVRQKHHETQKIGKQSKSRKLIEKVSSHLEKSPVSLPDGSTVNEVYANMAYLRQKNGLTSSCPVARLSENLVRHHPFWTIRLLRGHLATLPTFAVSSEKDIPPVEVSSQRSIPEKLEGYLFEMKALLKNRTEKITSGREGCTLMAG